MAAALSVVIPYYRNPSMLRRQLAVWRDEWPADLKTRCEIVLVDDGSPEPAADVVRAEPAPGLPVGVWRVLVDIPWHQHGARNLGAHIAVGKWLLMTDMDHVVPAETLAAVLDAAALVSGRTAFTFTRRDAPVGSWRAADWSDMALTLNAEGELKPHVNSYALSRRLWAKVGGYDEDYCGIYGTDRLFRDRLWKRAVHQQLNAPLIRVSRESIADASTTALERKDVRMRLAKKRVRLAKLAAGEADVIKTLQFPWERVL